MVVLFGFSSTYAASDTSSIFKIQAYSYNSISDMYQLEQYGSAVLVAKDILLTNAHVVTDNDNKFTLQYEACKTVSSSESPVCFSTLQLLSYDKNADLALLKIVTPTDDMPTPVTLWSGTLAVGATVNIIGYPANGGESITTTQGTIAWYEQWYYKTDANIDGGNSGWGGFDSAGNFIWIPTFVVNGQTTLGYLIPIDIIKQFLAGDIGTTSTQKVAPAFTKRLDTQYGLATQTRIDIPLFTTPAFSGYGLSLFSAIEKKNNNLYAYFAENTNTSQVRMHSLIATDDAAMQRYVSNEVKNFKSFGFSTQKATKKIWTTSRQVITSISDDLIIYEYVQSHSTNKTYLEFVVMVDKEDAKADLVDLQTFVESIIIKKSSTKPQVLNLPGVKLSSKRGVSIVKRIDEDGLNISLLPTSTNFTINLSAYPGAKWVTIKKIMTSIQSMLDDMWVDYSPETSKYPSKVLFVSTVDEDNNVKMSAIGTVKSGTTSAFIQADISLRSASNKKEVIAMIYKIFGLE